MLRRLVSMVVALLVLLGPGAFVRPALADDRVDVLLVLAADISRSVDDRKFRLQRDGYAAAIVDPRVVRAMAGGPMGRIALCFVEWAGDSDQTRGHGLDQCRHRRGGGGGCQAHSRCAARLHGAHIDQRRHRLRLGQLARSPFQSDRRVIDVSGDGTNNAGRPVTEARDGAVAQGVTINGLVILSEIPLATNPMHTHPPGGLTLLLREERGRRAWRVRGRG